MAYRKKPDTQIEKTLPEYGQLVSMMQTETASILSDYIRQWVGVINGTDKTGTGIYLNWDRILRTQTYQELAWYEMYQEVERDPHVSAIMSSAKINVAGMKWDIIPHLEAGQKKPNGRNKAIAEFVKHALLKTGFFPQHLYNLMDALGKGFSVSEIIWNIDSDGVTIKEIINRPQRRFQFDAIDRKPKLRTLENPYYGEALPEKKFIVHRCSSQWENPFGDALDQSLYWVWLFKKTVLKFWMQHLQVGASSIPIVQHPASANSALKNEALGIAEMIRNGAYGRIPDNFQILWAEAKNAVGNADAYERFNRMCNDEMSKCINGQTLTTEAGGTQGSGSRALGDVHQGTQNARDVYRAEALASTLNQTLIQWIADFNFGNLSGYPLFRFDLEQEANLAQEATIVKTLSDAGFEFDEVELSEKFNYTIMKKEVKPIPSALQQKSDMEEEIETEDKIKGASK